jgi:hypothetical protein
VTAWPRAFAASALVTTEQESKLPAAAALAEETEDAAALVAGALAAGALDEGAGADEDDEVQAASEKAAQLAMTEIATECRRI